MAYLPLDTDPTFNNFTGSVFTNEGNLKLNNSYSSSNPPTPISDISLFNRKKAGRNMMAQIGPSGVDYIFQPNMFSNKVGWWTALGDATTVYNINIGIQNTGTATTRAVNVNGFLSSLRRVGFVSTALVTASAGTRHGSSQFFIGNAPNKGGFFYVTRFGIQQTGSNYSALKIFVGMLASNAVIVANTQPTAQVNCFYVGKNSGSNTSWEFGWNDGSGTATTMSISSSISFNTSGAYEYRLFCPPSSSTVYFSFQDLNSGDYVEHSASSNIPSITTLIGPQLWVNNGLNGTAACSIDIISQYIETDN